MTSPDRARVVPARTGGVEPLLTVGHGTLALPELRDLLVGAEIEVLVDVRRFPASRRQPHLSTAVLEPALAEGGIRYRWDERLGGRRRLPAGAAEPDSWWTVTAFRAYAAHTRSLKFLAALEDLTREMEQARVAVMCSETVWWRCHRRLISDVVVAARLLPVRHLMHNGRTVPHPVAAGARLRPDGLLVWDGCPSR